MNKVVEVLEELYDFKGTFIELSELDKELYEITIDLILRNKIDNWIE